MKHYQGLVAATLLSVVPMAAVAEGYHWEDTYSVEELGAKSIDLNLPVATIDIKQVASDRIRLVVIIDEDLDDCTGKDTKEPQLKAILEDTELSVELVSEDCQADVSLELPASLALDINVGVGEITYIGNHDASIKVGVGTVNAYLNSSFYRLVDVTAGIGDVNLKLLNGKAEENNFAFLANEVTWRGKGERNFAIKAGVGSIDVHDKGDENSI